MIYELFVRIIADWAVVPVVVIGSYALVFKIPKGHRFQAYSRILMAGLTAYLFAKIIGYFYQPSLERPFEVLKMNAGASYLNNPGFPSDHVLFITAIVCAVWFETKQKVITFILIGLVCLICIGRVIALVHTPLDVMGGIVIAIFAALLWYGNKK